ncbi:hypothetical protein A2U01_0097265, partial [Trifolium medium]|nr:hypothetical protein [Trifolium medium]
DQPASEGKDTAGSKGAFVAQVVKGKEPIISDTVAATAPMKKRADKEKIEEGMKEKEKRKRTVAESERVTKKPRTQK